MDDMLTVLKELLQNRDIHFAIAILIMFIIISVLTKSCEMGAREVKKIIIICIIAGLLCKICISEKIKNMPQPIQNEIMQQFQQKLPFGRLL